MRELTRVQCWLDTLKERKKHLGLFSVDRIFVSRTSWIAAQWDEQVSVAKKINLLFAKQLQPFSDIYYRTGFTVTVLKPWESTEVHWESVLQLRNSCWQGNSETWKKISALRTNTAAKVKLPDHFPALLNLLTSWHSASSLYPTPKLAMKHCWLHSLIWSLYRCLFQITFTDTEKADRNVVRLWWNSLLSASVQESVC